MFWKIFAWTNLILKLPLLIGTIFILGGTVFLPLNFLALGLNDVVLLIVPFLLAYKIYDIKYLTNELLSKMVLIFVIMYNFSHIITDIVEYSFVSIPHFLHDMFYYSLIILSITSFVLYLGKKEVSKKEVAKKEIIKKVDILWKINFYVLFFFSPLAVIGVFIAPDFSSVGLDLKIVIAVSLLLNLLGIYGLAWNKRIISAFFWKAFFVAIIVSNIYYGFVEIEGLQITTLTDLISSIILALMLYVPIYIYAFCSKDLWGGKISGVENN